MKALAVNTVIASHELAEILNVHVCLDPNFIHYCLDPNFIHYCLDPNFIRIVTANISLSCKSNSSTYYVKARTRAGRISNF